MNQHKKFALFSDVHGNTPGLKAVLAAIQKVGGVQHIIAAGDLVQGGPGTIEILDLLDQYGVKGLRGNWEEAILDPEAVDAHVSSIHRDYASRCVAWLRERMGPDGLNRLASLPFDLRLEAAPGQVLYVCHAAPGDTWSRTCLPDHEAGLYQKVYGGIEADVVAFGHAHGHYVLWLDDKLLVNVSSVGERTDGLAAYTILDYTDHWTAHQYLVPYDVAEEARELSAARPPVYA